MGSRFLGIVGIILGLLLASASAFAQEAAADSTRDRLKFIPTFGLRLRQEVLRNVLYFAPDEPSRNWLRLRTRLGFSLERGGQRLSLRLVNSHRHVFTPDEVKFDWDELIVERLVWTWTRRSAWPFTLSLGRQDVIWNRGFLVLEGTPLDGSRSIYQNALRLILPRGDRTLELLGIYNPQEDDLVLVGDEKRPLADADELALAARYASPANELALLWKREEDPDAVRPDRSSWTLGYRRREVQASGPGLLWALALQRLRVAEDANWAFAFQGSFSRIFARVWQGELGGMYYSGDEGGTWRYRVPFGRWPKWSELYIYTLIPEDGVAAWQNITGPWLKLSRPVGKWGSARLVGFLLYAPASAWQSRGQLLEAELRFRLSRRLTGHLLAEWLAPGSYPAGQMSPTYFLRWQLNFEI